MCLYEKENDNCCKDTKVPCQTGISKPNKLYNINFNNNKECDFNLNLEKHNLIKVKKSKHKRSKHKKSKKNKHKKKKDCKMKKIIVNIKNYNKH